MFNSYEELMKTVEDRRQDTLTLEVDLGAEYSPEYEAAKTELDQAKAMQSMLGNGNGFMSDNIEQLKTRVAELKPEPNSVWVRFSRLKVGEWSMLVKQAELSPIEQYEKVLGKTFIGVYGQDPAEDGVEPLSTDPALLSSRSDKSILPGGMLHQVVQAFMSWQNASGEVSIRPTKSGRD